MFLFPARFLVGVGVIVWCLCVVLGEEKSENVCELGVMDVVRGYA